MGWVGRSCRSRINVAGCRSRVGVTCEDFWRCRGLGLAKSEWHSGVGITFKWWWQWRRRHMGSSAVFKSVEDMMTGSSLLSPTLYLVWWVGGEKNGSFFVIYSIF